MPLDGGPSSGKRYSVGQRLLSPASFRKSSEKAEMEAESRNGN